MNKNANESHKDKPNIQKIEMSQNLGGLKKEEHSETFIAFRSKSQDESHEETNLQMLTELMEKCSCLCVTLFHTNKDKLQLIEAVNPVLSEDKSQSLRLLIGNSVQINNHSIVGSSAMNKCAYIISDVYDIGLQNEFLFNPVVDRMLGFRCKSMITFPIIDHNNSVVAIIQLINHVSKEDKEKVTAENHNQLANDFDESYLAILKSFSGQYLEYKKQSSPLDSAA